MRTYTLPNSRHIKFLVAFVLLIVVMPVNAKPNYDGTYRNNSPLGEMVITLHQENDGKVNGKMSNAGIDFQLTASPKGDGIYGVMKGTTPDDILYIDAKLNGSTLSVDLISPGVGGEPDNNQKVHLDFTRDGGAAVPITDTANKKVAGKPAKNKPAVKPTKPAEKIVHNDTEKPIKHAAGDTSGWKTFKHATGIFIKYPSNWTMKTVSAGAQLVPPDQAANASGPTEAYLITGDSSYGVTDIDDPRVAQYAQTTMQQMIPFLQVKGEPQHVSGGTAPGVVMTWEGDNPQGLHIQAKVYSIILKGYAISVVAIGEKDKIQKRLDTVQKIFTSIGAGESQIDQRLVGRWHHWSYHTGAGGNYSSETDIHAVLNADGTCSMSQRGETGVTFKAPTGETTGNSVGDNHSGNQGTWSASDGKLYITWNDGSSLSYEYEFSGRQLNLRSIGSNEKPMEWMPE